LYTAVVETSHIIRKVNLKAEWWGSPVAQEETGTRKPVIREQNNNNNSVLYFYVLH
jgi:hypothetical protein